MLLSGVILAGGEGRRMHGQDKGLINVLKKPLIEYAIECLSPLVDDLSISCNRNKSRYSDYNIDCLPDYNSPGNNRFLGPMAGIVSGLKHANHDWLMILPCDTPLMNTNMMKQLSDTVRESKTKGLQAVVFSYQGLQPLHGIYHKTLLPILERSLAENNNSVQKLIRSVDTIKILHAKDATHQFINANDAKELSIIEQLITP